MEVSNEQVLGELFRGMDTDRRAVLCSVGGDPSIAGPSAWGGTPWGIGTTCPLRPDRNNYVAISSFAAAPLDGRFRRRKDQFAAMHAIMVDDLGTKLSVDALPSGLIPSLVVETSPGNYQATFFLTTPQTNQALAEDAIRQIIAVLTSGGVDPGMAGVTRVLRLPVGINGKPKYGGWRCRVHVWRPEIRTEWDDLRRAFGLVEHYRLFKEPVDGVARERMRGYRIVKDGLRQMRLIKHERQGWIDIHCPWLDEHTGRADTGTAISSPAQANGYYGGFKCHHGHCEARNWGDLEDMVARLVWKNGQRTAGPFYDTR